MVNPKDMSEKIRRQGYVTLKDLDTIWKDDLSIKNIFEEISKISQPPKGFVDQGLENLARNIKIIACLSPSEQLYKDPLRLFTEERIISISKLTGMSISSIVAFVDNLRDAIGTMRFDR